MKLHVLLAAVVGALAVAGGAAAGPGGITIKTTSLTAGVTFGVTAQQNKSDVAVEIDCYSDSAHTAQNYGTRLYVPLKNGAATTVPVYPPAGTAVCIGILQDPARIGVFRTLSDTGYFAVTP